MSVTVLWMRGPASRPGPPPEEKPPFPGGTVWQGPLWLVGISLAAGLAAGLVCARFGPWAFCGVRQVGLCGGPAPEEPLRIEGPYRYVRHPLMALVLIFLWVQPIM